MIVYTEKLKNKKVLILDIRFHVYNLENLYRLQEYSILNSKSLSYIQTQIYILNHCLVMKTYSDKHSKSLSCHENELRYTF